MSGLFKGVPEAAVYSAAVCLLAAVGWATFSYIGSLRVGRIPGENVKLHPVLAGVLVTLIIVGAFVGLFFWEHR